jgi:hypothetical protein
MELAGLEIPSLLTSAAVLLVAAVVAVALLSGLAAEAMLYFEDLGHRWQARSLNARPQGGPSRARVAAEQGRNQ